MSRGEAEMNRRRYFRDHLLPFVQGFFDKYEGLQSAMLCVAQYWSDEANDAVHGSLIVSELPVPRLDGASHGYGGAAPDPNVPNTKIAGEYSYGEGGSVAGLWRAGWDSNSGSIPLWAAFSPEGGSQEQEEMSEGYAPAALFYRHGGYEMLSMTRPFLDGVRPEWGADDDT